MKQSIFQTSSAFHPSSLILHPFLACWTLILCLASPALAGHVWWQARDGTTSGYTENANWADLQAAITNAQVGSATTGLVKISGDITRTNSAWGQLDVTNGGVLTISGGWNWPGGGGEPTVQEGRSQLQANSAALANNIRVMRVSASRNVTLDGLILTGGRQPADEKGGGLYVTGASHSFQMRDVIVSNNIVAGGWLYGGGGLSIESSTSLTNVRISRCEFVGNQCGLNTGGSGGRGPGGAIQIQGAGTTASPLIIEYCVISNNASSGYYAPYAAGLHLGSQSGVPPIVIVANTRLVGNRAGGREGTPTSAIGTSYDSQLTIFGSLIAGNTDSSGSTNHVVLSYNGHSTSRPLRMANTTIAGNVGGSISLGTTTHWDAKNYDAWAVNGILETTRIRLGGCTGYARNGHRLNLQNTLIHPNPSYDSFYGAGRDPGTGTVEWTYTNTLANALTLLDAEGYQRFLSLTSGNAVTNAMEDNIEGDPMLLGGGGQHPFSLSSTSPGVNTGLARSGTAFTYVDLNTNGAYNALMDVIVAGTAPAGNHWVYTTDLAGNPRLQGPAIDRGAYEVKDFVGTVFRFQ